MRKYLALLLLSTISLACLYKDLGSDEGFMLCDESGLNFFEPTNKTSITPTKGSFIDTLCVPLEIEEGRSFVNLTSAKVCLLEQNLGLIAEKINAEMCEDVFTMEELDLYFYQYLGVVIGQQEYIFVNAFKSNSIDSANWKREPYIGLCNDGISKWSVLFNLDDRSFEQYQSQLSWEVFSLDEFPYSNLDCARCIGIQDLETFPLNQNEVCLVKSNFDKLEEEISVGCYNEGKMINFNRDWLYQYTGVQKDGNRWVYINAEQYFASYYEQKRVRQRFYSEFLPSVCDGGTRYFGVFFNLDSKEFMDLQFNAL